MRFGWAYRREIAATPMTGRSRNSWVRRHSMGLGRGILLWLLGIPIPIIILLALIWR